MTQKKAPKPWTEYLLDCIGNDIDPEIRAAHEVFNVCRLERLEGRDADSIREELTKVRNEVVEKCRARDHTEKLLDSAIEYVIDPEKKLIV